MGTLSVVATPIGNLEDITLRALRVLKEADMIACEDTRVSKKLLAYYDIYTPTISYHAHSGDIKVEKILALLKEGKHIALISDAGTPGVSDPGSILVSRALEAGARVEAVPGASALTTALSVAGIPLSSFIFLGFLPQKKGRQTTLKDIAHVQYPSILYESTHRIEKLLIELSKYAPKSKVVILKELTKIYEMREEGTPEELLAFFRQTPEKKKGEFVVIVTPQKSQK